MSDAVLFVFRFLLFVAVHSILAIPSLKRRVSEKNKHLSRFYRVYYNLLSLALFGWTMAVFRNSTVLYVVPGAWSLVMYFMQLLFLIILFACTRQSGAAEFLGIHRLSAAGAQTHTLITSGCYRVVRHPLYLYSLLFLLCNPVISTRWLLLTLLSAIYFVIGARLEETRLVVEFGDEYRAYQHAVPFMFPRIFRR
ncbi:MAG: NnrU family protein [Desulfuromonadaceae bacterium]|nr:NnrU family protein [Desulfuromonadaceae bacterium]